MPDQRQGDDHGGAVRDDRAHVRGVVTRVAGAAPDIESALGGVSPGWTPPPASRPGVTAGSAPGLSLVGWSRVRHVRGGHR